MCILINQPAGKEISKTRAKRLWGYNPDGGGFAYMKPAGGIGVRKEMEFNEYWPLYRSHRGMYGNDNPMMLHFRIATHGTVNAENIHPFHINENMVMGHNGVIHDIPTSEEISDTRIFISDVLPELPETWLDQPYLVAMVEEWIGWSKLMFLTDVPYLKENVYILNAATWTDSSDGLQYSNTSGLSDYSNYKKHAGSYVWQENYDYTYQGGGYSNTHQKPSSYSSYEGKDYRPQNDKIYIGWLETKRMSKYPKPGDMFESAGEIWCSYCEEVVEPEGDCACHTKMCEVCEQWPYDCGCISPYFISAQQMLINSGVADVYEVEDIVPQIVDAEVVKDNKKQKFPLVKNQGVPFGAWLEEDGW